MSAEAMGYLLGAVLVALPVFIGREVLYRLRSVARGNGRPR